MNRRRSSRFTVAIAAVALSPFALVACGDDEAADPAPVPAGTDAPAAAGAELTIADFTFSPLTVAAGAEITLTNNDGFTHTVSNPDGAFDVRVSGGASEKLTIDAAGTYAIMCNIHPSMSGSIVVE
ncbi:MAG: cupredoxin domain-containing protein [Actinomycetota bacterium]|jgi:plastocyanin|nr:MAG: hypothetical protein FD127_1022 [Acidimicrobiaceae bacterium]